MTDWPSVPLFALIRELDDRGHPDLEVLSVYRELGVVPKTSREDNFNKTPEDLSSYKRVRAGDLVINKMKAWSGSLAVSPYDGIVSGDYMVCAVVGPADRRFLHYVLRSKPVFSEIAARSTGIRPSQWRLYWDDLRQIRVPLPALDEQRAIADYLDTETNRIDRLVEATSQQSRLAEERLRAEIALAVWDGGRRDVRGIRSVRIRHVARVNPDSPAHRQLELEEALTFLPLEAVWPGHVLDVSQSRPWGHVRSGFTRFVEGDVLVPRITPTFQAGRVAVARGLLRGLGTGTTELHIIRCGERLIPEYLAYALNTMPFLQAGEGSMYGVAGQQRVPDDFVRNFRIPVPGVAEQRNLVRQFDEVSMGFEELSGLLERRVALLRERRQSLVTAVTRGQFNMRGVAA